MSAGLLGYWKAMSRNLGTLGVRTREYLEEFPAKRAVRCVSEIKKGITSQSPGGKQFQALAQATIDARRRKYGKKGGEKALIDTGAMREAVTSKEVEKGIQFVGLLRTQMHRPKDGEEGESIEMANIGAIHEFGTDDGHVPARPFVQPILDVERPKAKKDLAEDIGEIMRG
jgi:hypothetical protein